MKKVITALGAITISMSFLLNPGKIEAAPQFSLTVSEEIEAPLESGETAKAELDGNVAQVIADYLGCCAVDVQKVYRKGDLIVNKLSASQLQCILTKSQYVGAVYRPSGGWVIVLEDDIL
ncbi:MAG: hypothetical protein AAGN35_04165 [Bacteroidota bacterium]